MGILHMFREPKRSTNEHSKLVIEQEKRTSSEVGVLFDAEVLGGSSGFYGWWWSTFKIFFKTLVPEKMCNCTVYAGDMLGLPGEPQNYDYMWGPAPPYGIVVQTSDPKQSSYFKEAFLGCKDEGLFPPQKRFVEGNDIIESYHLLKFGYIDSQGILHVGEARGVGQALAEGTTWIITRDEK